MAQSFETAVELGVLDAVFPQQFTEEGADAITFMATHEVAHALYAMRYTENGLHVASLYELEYADDDEEPAATDVGNIDTAALSFEPSMLTMTVTTSKSVNQAVSSSHKRKYDEDESSAKRVKLEAEHYTNNNTYSGDDLDEDRDLWAQVFGDDHDKVALNGEDLQEDKQVGGDEDEDAEGFGEARSYAIFGTVNQAIREALPDLKFKEMPDLLFGEKVVSEEIKVALEPFWKPCPVI